LITALSAATSNATLADTEIALIPAPQSLVSGEGQFRLDASTPIVITAADDAETRAVATDLQLRLRSATGWDFPILMAGGDPAQSGAIVLVREESFTGGAEGYTLQASAAGVIITAGTPAGLFYGTRTLLQLLPPEVFGTEGAAIADGDRAPERAEPERAEPERAAPERAAPVPAAPVPAAPAPAEPAPAAPAAGWTVPAVRIEDAPRFGWRGLLLDCGRHFMTVDYVKRMIDLLAIHKLNRLHWHLTEDQGWRLEIRKYPRLTEIGAWRSYDDGSSYGGYYTQQQVREIVAYAASRHVTIVPEIELPGHCRAALAAYPELSCNGGPHTVATRWGVFADVYCAGNDEVFRFLEDVLIEVMELFPGEYIHIGGDEVPKQRWQECSQCQARIAAENLADVDELQSWFIRRIDRFLTAHGRKLIGWDEILTGGLAPEATVQSWRGFAGALAAARAGHDAIVSPTSHAYFDYDVGRTNLAKVYSFDPVPPELTAAEAKHIIGGEMNMWTEYAPQEKVDSKVFPRLLAMAEVLWTGPQQGSFKAFFGRVRKHYERLDRMGVRYGPEARPVVITPRYEAGRDGFLITCSIDSELPGDDGVIRYTLDGKPVTAESRRYRDPFFAEGTVSVRARAFVAATPYGSEASATAVDHAALGRPVQLADPPAERYRSDRNERLTDGLRGTIDHRDGHWTGFEGVDLIAVIDLGEQTVVHEMSAGFLQRSAAWIFLPREVEFAVSGDGESFTVVGLDDHEISGRRSDRKVEEFKIAVSGLAAR
jgi:hexosaminidase